MEPTLALLRRITKEEWTGAEKTFSTLVGQMKTNAKHVAERKAQRSTGSTIVQVGTMSGARSQKLSESGNKKRGRRNGNGREAL